MSKLQVTYVDHLGNDLTVTNAARISHNKSSDELSDKDKKLIKYLADNEHMSPFEHCVLTVIIECPLYIRSQIHRHRTMSFNEVSRRYSSDDISFYIPPVDDIRSQSKSNKQASDGPIEKGEAVKASAMMEEVAEQCLKTYEKLLAMGVSREQARAILPQSTSTKFYATANLRNWVHFIQLRDHHHSQKEVQYIAKAVKDILMTHFPEATKALLN